VQHAPQPKSPPALDELQIQVLEDGDWVVPFRFKPSKSRKMCAKVVHFGCWRNNAAADCCWFLPYHGQLGTNPVNSRPAATFRTAPKKGSPNRLLGVFPKIRADQFRCRRYSWLPYFWSAHGKDRRAWPEIVIDLPAHPTKRQQQLLRGLMVIARFSLPVYSDNGERGITTKHRNSQTLSPGRMATSSQVRFLYD